MFKRHGNVLGVQLCRLKDNIIEQPAASREPGHPSMSTFRSSNLDKGAQVSFVQASRLLISLSSRNSSRRARWKKSVDWRRPPVHWASLRSIRPPYLILKMNRSHVVGKKAAEYVSFQGAGRFNEQFLELRALLNQVEQHIAYAGPHHFCQSIEDVAPSQSNNISQIPSTCWI